MVPFVLLICWAVLLLLRWFGFILFLLLSLHIRRSMTRLLITTFIITIAVIIRRMIARMLVIHIMFCMWDILFLSIRIIKIVVCVVWMLFVFVLLFVLFRFVCLVFLFLWFGLFVLLILALVLVIIVCILLQAIVTMFFSCFDKQVLLLLFLLFLLILFFLKLSPFLLFVCCRSYNKNDSYNFPLSHYCRCRFSSQSSYNEQSCAHYYYYCHDSPP